MGEIADERPDHERLKVGDVITWPPEGAIYIGTIKGVKFWDDEHHQPKNEE